MNVSVAIGLAICSAVCFFLKGAGVQAGVDFDGLGKGFFVTAIIFGLR